MAETKLQNKEKVVTPKLAKKESDPSLNGTLLSVFLLGGFLILSWVGVFMLYMTRN